MLFSFVVVAAGIADLLHMVADLDDLLLRQALGLGHDLIRLRDGRNDFGDVKDSLAAVALDDLHGDSSFYNRINKCGTW